MRLIAVWAFVFSVICSCVCAGQAATTEANGPEVWSTLSGMRDELEAEKLELRDELIAANLGYLTALDQALRDILILPRVSPKLPLAWSRVEYLLETSYRLVESTGELEQFLKTTQQLRPSFPEPPEPVDPAAMNPEELDPAGGLVYRDENGTVVPTYMDGRLVLVDPASTLAVNASESIVAAPAVPEQETLQTISRLIQSRAAWLRGEVLERLGRTDQASAETDELGLIRDWLVLGPVESDSESTSELIYGLEELYESLSETTSYPGKNGPVRWRPFSSIDSLGRIKPEALFRSEGIKAAYFLALVHSRQNREAIVRFGSNAPITVCVNHSQVRRDGSPGDPDPDQEAVPVWLRKGWNVILVRTSASPGEWSFALRLTARDGSPFPAHIAMPKEANLGAILTQAKNAAKRSLLERHFLPSRPAERGGVSVLYSWLAQHPEDARANFYLAMGLVAKRMMEGPDRFGREIVFRRALELSNNDPYFSLMAGRSVDSGIDGPDREENFRLVLLQAAADKGSAAALVDIGRLYLDVMRQPRRADEYAELALAVNPISLRAGLLDYDVAVEMNWLPVAEELLNRLAKRHPTAAAARLRQGRAALARGRHREALGEFHAVLGVDAENAEALDGAVVAMGMLGQTSAAIELLVSHIEKFPYDLTAKLKLAELYRTIGRDAESLAVVEAVLQLAPDDPVALAMRTDADRKIYAEGKVLPALPAPRMRQELDMSPPRQQPPNGWEYLYFQVEDRMAKNGSIHRTVSFALKIYTARAARMLRHLGFWLERDYEEGTITMLNLVQPNGTREPFTPPLPTAGQSSLTFHLPPLRVGMAVEAEVEIKRARIPFLGDYFGQIAPLSQQAPVRLSHYLFVSPKDRRIYFRPVNGAPEAMVVESADGQEVTRIWEMSNLPAFIPEPNSPGQDQIMPCVQMSSFGDWDEFSRWYWRLIGGQYHTPPELRQLAERLGAGTELALVKLDRAAEWMSQNIGHREWSFGPYAFRPINARSILSRLAADGKDRTLFLCLLAREYGLDAWPVLTRMRNRRYAPAGSDDLSLPLLDHFNHSLVLVESRLGGDVFMDASNPYRAPGVMPSQLFGAAGMAITASSAHRVVIPDNGVEACRWEETADMVVDPDGSVIWEESLHCVGTAAETLRRRFRNPETRLDAWTAYLSSIGGTPSAAAEEFLDDPSQPSGARFSGRARLRNWATVENDRVVLEIPELPGALSAETGRPAFPLSLEEMARVGLRQQDLILPYGFRISRTVSISYPEEWRLVNPVKPFRKNYPFGLVALDADASAPGKLLLHFTIELPGYQVAAGDFPAFREASALAARWLKPLLVWEKP